MSWITWLLRLLLSGGEGGDEGESPTESSSEE